MYDDKSIPTHALGPSLSDKPTHSPATRTSEFSGALQTLRACISTSEYSETDLQHLMNSIPREAARKMVYKYAGMDASFLTSLTKQVQLVDAVLDQIVTPDGNLRPVPEGVDINLKDALGLSIRVTQMLLRDLPKLYTVDRLQKLERAIGDVMDESFTEEQQMRVLERLQELTGA